MLETKLLMIRYLWESEENHLFTYLHKHFYPYRKITKKQEDLKRACLILLVLESTKYKSRSLIFPPIETHEVIEVHGFSSEWNRKRRGKFGSTCVKLFSRPFRAVATDIPRADELPSSTIFRHRTTNSTPREIRRLQLSNTRLSIRSSHIFLLPILDRSSMDPRDFCFSIDYFPINGAAFHRHREAIISEFRRGFFFFIESSGRRTINKIRLSPVSRSVAILATFQYIRGSQCWVELGRDPIHFAWPRIPECSGGPTPSSSSSHRRRVQIFM